MALRDTELLRGTLDIPGPGRLLLQTHLRHVMGRFLLNLGLPTLVGATLLALTPPAGALPSVDGGQHPDRRAPFTAIRWPAEDDAHVEIEVDGHWWRWRGIDATSIGELVAFARDSYGEGLLRKRIAEDLVEVLLRMDREPGPTVDLSVSAPDDDEVERLEAVPMTHENRRAVMRYRDPERDPEPSQEPTPSPLPEPEEPAPARSSPFSGLRWTASGDLEVEVGGRWWRLLAVDRIPVERLEAVARERFKEGWRKRIAEDLPDVMAAAGRRLGRTCELALLDREAGVAMVIPDVELTEDNRVLVRRTWEAMSSPPAVERVERVERVTREHAAFVAPAQERLARPWPTPGPGPLPRSAAKEDLDQLEHALEHRFAYLRWKGFDHRVALDSLRAGLPPFVDREAFALRLQELLARFGDGHAGVRSFRDAMSGRFLPVLLESTRDGIVAIRPDRSSLLDDERPVVAGLDALPLEAWLEAAARYVPAGSAQLVQRRSLRLLRQLDHFREELGLQKTPEVRLHLRAASGGPVRTLTLPTAEARPVYGPWPQQNTRTRDDGIAYLRLFQMGRADEIDELMSRWRDARGLILDLRGNGGGRRDVIRELVPYFMNEEDPPLAINVAARRLAPGEPCPPATGCLENRFLHPLTAELWSETQRARVSEVLDSFDPEWQPAADELSPWHVMLVDRRTNPEAYSFPAPVVVLLDAGCFSATDILLSALAQLPRVTLIGTPSSGGSARSFGIRLAHSGLEIGLASMASFRPDGRLLDGHGVEPDVRVEPAPGDLLEGGGDAQLEAAIRVLTREAAGPE